jgi:SAM-dependent methyltransferase
MERREKRAPSLGDAEGSRRPVPLVETALLERRSEGRLLDIGCGQGYGLQRFREYGFRALGLEMGRSALLQAQDRGPVLQGTAHQLPVRDSSLDVVVIFQVLHHVESPESALEEIRRVLRPGGYLLLWETTEDSPLVAIGRRLRPEWEDVPVRARFSRAELRTWLLDLSFHLVEEVSWGTVVLAASAVGQLVPPLRRLVTALWRADVWLSKRLPFGQGFYVCLAQRSS